MSLVFGVGIYIRGQGGSVGGKHTKTYQTWCGMLERCYSKSLHKIRPTYTGCEVSENFKYFSFFSRWCENQIGFNNKGFHLDKDLLIKGNKFYSEDTCVFLPNKMNSTLTKRERCRGTLPLGVYEFQGKYRALCCADGKQRHLGMFETAESAFEKHKEFKEAYVKRCAELYRTVIDPRAYAALVNYTVEITD